jgi:hypothetical protein
MMVVATILPSFDGSFIFQVLQMPGYKLHNQRHGCMAALLKAFSMSQGI